MALIAPSLLAANFGHLAEEVRAVEAAGADWLHLDIMDGHFVPNISFGPDVLRAIRPATRLPFDVHLMIAPVDPYLEAFARAGAHRLTVHAEATPHLDRTLQVIRSLGVAAGVAINPATPEAVLAYVLDAVDLVLVMTVNPGFGGQAYLPGMERKLAQVRAMIGARPIHLQVDGGITPGTAAGAVRAGADVLVAGSAVFGTDCYEAAIRGLREAAEGIATSA